MSMLVAGVGYRNLRDLSFGPVVVDKLRTFSWPQGVEIEDLSYGPISVVHRLQEHPAARMVQVVMMVMRMRMPAVVRHRALRQALLRPYFSEQP